MIIQEIKPAQTPIYKMLAGRYITLEKLSMQDIDVLYPLTHDTDELKKVWDYLPYGPFETVESMKDCYQKLLNIKEQLIFCVKNIQTKSPLGIIALIDCKPAMGNVEIGHVMYPTQHQKCAANTEAVYLLINYCINQLDFRKIVWKCNDNNLESKRAALRLGFEFEGIFYNHMIVKGKNRDTAWYGIIDKKWPILAKNYECWLSNSEPKLEKRPSLAAMNNKVQKYSQITLS